MAWSWSHTHGAYRDARDNVGELDRETLETVYAEIETFKAVRTEEHPVCPGDHFDESVYQDALEIARRKNLSTLADHVWAFAEYWRTCTNGGWKAYICPYGCHKVPFERQ